MKRITIQRSIFSQSVALFLVIILPLFFVGMMIFRHQEEMLLRSYENRMELEISNYFEQLEKDVQTIKSQQDLMAGDDDLQYLLNKDIFNYYVGNAINSIGTKFSLMNAGYIDESNVYIRSLGRRITVRDQRSIYQKSDMETMSGLVQNPGENLLQCFNGQLYIVTRPFSHDDSVSSLQYLIYSRISLEDVYAKMSAFAQSTESVSFLSFDSYEIQYAPQKVGLFERIRTENFAQNHHIAYYQTLDGREYFVLGYYSSALDAKYAQAVPTEMLLADIRPFHWWYWLFCLLLALSVIAFAGAIHKTIKKPMDILLDGFKQLETGNFSVQLPARTEDEFAVGFRSFNHMARRLDHLVNEVYAGKILIQRAELRQLQAQINPHFLYNSFFILRNRIADGRKEEARSFCDMLGHYFAFITRNDQDSTTLKEEVLHARIYAEIQAIRFQDRVQLLFDNLPEEFEDLYVPRLILQPVLENAFLYGLERMEYDGVLSVQFAVHGSFLDIVVEDNGEDIEESGVIQKIDQVLKSESSLHESSALYNINRRVQILCGTGCGLFVEKSARLGGLKAVIRLDTLRLKEARRKGF